MKKLKFMVESTNGSIKKGQGSLSNIKNYLTKEFDNIKSFKIMDESIYSPRLLDDAWRELKRRARKNKFISTEALENVSRDFAEDPETRVVSRSLSDRLYDELIEKMDAEGYELMPEDEYNDKFDSPKWQPDTLKYYYAKKKAVNESKNLNEGYNDLTVGELKDILQGVIDKLDDYEDSDVLETESNTYYCGSRFISVGSKGFVDLRNIRLADNDDGDEDDDFDNE